MTSSRAGPGTINFLAAKALTSFSETRAATKSSAALEMTSCYRVMIRTQQVPSVSTLAQHSPTPLDHASKAGPAKTC